MSKNINIIENSIQTIINNNERMSWDEYFISSALLVSCRSPSNKLKVGCAIIKDNRIISCG